MHGIDLTTQMDIFYHAMNYASKGIIDASCSGVFKRRSAEEARELIEDLAKCNYKAPSEASGSSSRLRGSGLIELNRMTAIEAKLDVVMNKLGSNERRMHTAHEVGAVKEGIKSSDEGPVEEEPYQVEETKYMMSKEVITSSLTSTCPLTIHQHLGTMRISHMVEEHNRAPNLDRITIKLMLNPCSKNSCSRGTIEENIRVKKGLNNLKIICCISC